MLIPLLTKIAAPTASEVCQSFVLQPAAEKLLTPEMTPTQFLDTLQQNKLSTDSVNLLAHGMPEQEAVGWVCQSTEMVSDKLGPADLEALQAAQAWVQNPCEQTMQEAAQAASATDYQSPAAWAAQGAAWSQGASASSLGAAPAAPTGLTGDAVAGSVMLAAALSAPQAPSLATPSLSVPGLPQVPSLDLQAPELALPTPDLGGLPSLNVPALDLTPAQQAQTAELYQPFIDRGIEIASGQTPVA